MSYASFLAYLFWNERKKSNLEAMIISCFFLEEQTFRDFHLVCRVWKTTLQVMQPPGTICVGGSNLLWDMEFRASLVGMLAYCLIPFDFISKSGSQSGMMRYSAAGWYQMSTPLNICGPCLHIVKYPRNIYIPLRVDSMWRILQRLILKLKIPFL